MTEKFSNFQTVINFFRAFAGRIRRRTREQKELRLGGLTHLLKTAAPTCLELVASCQTGTGAIVRGDQCCRLLFQVIQCYQLLFEPN